MPGSSSKQCSCYYNVTGERARELLFLYGCKGEFLVRPSESNANDNTLSVHRGNRVTHVKIPCINGVHRLPSGEEFSSLEDVVKYLVKTPNLLSEKDGTFIEATSPVKIPIVLNVVNIGTDRFFHINITGADAEDLLSEEPNGTYLIRESTSNPGEYALSVKNEDVVLHVRIYHMDARFCIVPNDNFLSLEDLISNYVRMPMVQNGGSVVRLKAPLHSTRFTAASIDDRIHCLLKTIRKNTTKDGFVEEFEKLYRERKFNLYISCKEGRKPENVCKNRYRNVVPYDHTRIKLRLSTGDDSTQNDYINANFINVLHEGKYTEFSDFQRTYISTQGCLQETVSDFWHMLWQEDARTVVMITKEVERGRIKCFRYWPEMGATLTVGPSTCPLEVLTTTEHVTKECVRRIFKICRPAGGNDVREIFHYQFLGWEDNGCPSSSILYFLEDINKCLTVDCPPTHRDGPVVVHCSAGIGRTGTLIALDILINRIKKIGAHCIVDIQKTVRMLRDQRATMVQTEEQYRFVYYAISAYMKLRREREQQV